MANTSRNVVVFGGTGFYGQHIVRGLLRLGAPVRVLSRNRNHALSILGNEVEIQEGDVRDPQYIRKALEDVDAVIIALSAMKWNLIRHQRAIERDAVLEILRQSRELGIKRLVYLSGYEIRFDLLHQLGIPEFGAIKWEMESTILDSAFDWTILGCPPSFELFFTFYNKGKMIAPGGGKRALPTIAPEDVGAIAAQAVLMDDMKEKRLRITGERAWSIPEAAELMSRITGKDIRVQTIPLAALNVVSRIVKPFHPYMRELYKSVLLFNNFPSDLVDQVPTDHQKLLKIFDYKPISFSEAIHTRMEMGFFTVNE